MFVGICGSIVVVVVGGVKAAICCCLCLHIHFVCVLGVVCFWGVLCKKVGDLSVILFLEGFIQKKIWVFVACFVVIKIGGRLDNYLWFINVLLICKEKEMENLI